MRLSKRTRSWPRHGVSLLEVLAAFVIFLVAFVAINDLVSQSARRAVYVQQREQATMLCQSKLAEVAAGAIPLTTQQDMPFEEDPAWVWSLFCQPHGTIPGLWNVEIRVARANPDIDRVECVLTQMILDPAMRGSTADMNMITGTESTDPAAAPPSNPNP